MALKDKLQIILVTYNREKHLENTLNQLFSDNSPVKDFDITILDNHSTDGTKNLIQKFQKRFSNLKHIIHPRNIGGNANICRAFEIAQKEYLWVLCDDDSYDWTHWDEVEKAIKEDTDLIVVSNYLEPKHDIAQLVKQLTFVPAGIYKTKYIIDETLINAYYNISNMFPQMGIFADYINNNRKIYICDHAVVTMVTHTGEDSYIRGSSESVAHPYMKNNAWYFGFVNAMQVFKGKKTKSYLIKNMDLNMKNRTVPFRELYELNKKKCHGNLTNLTDYFCALNKKQKFGFVWDALCCVFFKCSPIVIYRTAKDIKIRLFYKIKIRIWNKKWFTRNNKKPAG